MADLTAVFRRPFAEQVAALRLRLGNQVGTAAWDDLWQGQHDRAFTVAGALKADLLADLAAAFDKVVSQGTTLDEFRRDFRRIVEERGWHGWTGEGTKKGEAWRTRVIYRTNILTTYAAGRRAQLLEGNYRWWVYRHGGSLEPRPHHLSWDGVALPPDHPFWATHSPPNGWGCSCRVFGARTEAGIRRVGGVPGKELPPGWDAIDGRTGAPPGIDRGWAYAPGASATDEIRTTLARKAAALPPTLGAALAAAAEAREARPRLPFEDAAAPRTMAEAAELATAYGVAQAAGFTSSMRLEGVARIIRTAHEVRERFDLGPLRFLGHLDRHPGGRVRVPKSALACYVPATNAVCLRANVTEAGYWSGREPKPYDGAILARWRADLQAAAPQVRARAPGVAWQWANVSDIDTLMVHEMGHRLHRAHLREIEDIALQADIWRERWQLLVSRYGAMNFSEFIAESFVLYLRGGAEGHARLHPALLAFFKSRDRFG